MEEEEEKLALTCLLQLACSTADSILTSNKDRVYTVTLSKLSEIKHPFNLE